MNNIYYDKYGLDLNMVLSQYKYRLTDKNKHNKGECISGTQVAEWNNTFFVK